MVASVGWRPLRQGNWGQWLAGRHEYSSQGAISPHQLHAGCSLPSNRDRKAEKMWWWCVMRVRAEEEVKQIEGRRGLGFERCYDQMRETTWEGGRWERVSGEQRKTEVGERIALERQLDSGRERKRCRRSEREKWKVGNEERKTEGRWKGLRWKDE